MSQNTKYIDVIRRPGDPYREKLCLRSRVWPEAAAAEGTVFPYTDRSRPVNNVFIFLLLGSV